MRLCSACLLGLECRYDRRTNIDHASPELLAEYKRNELMPICPEQLGGLPTPRSGIRISMGDGNDVLDGKSRCLTDDGHDVTEQCIKGAYESLKIAQAAYITEAVLKQKSPSCGSGLTQGGFDKRMMVEGIGVTTALFRRNGIIVKSEKEF